MVFQGNIKILSRGNADSFGSFYSAMGDNRPLGERAVYLSDKDMMYKQHFVLKNICAPCIRKTGNLLFLLEQAGKAGISGQKHCKQVVVKQGLFSKSIRA
jgi:hypothetical protein